MKKIVWAIDVYGQDPKMDRSVLNAIQMLTRKTGAQVIPVYTLTAGSVDPIAFSENLLWIREYRKSAKAKLDDYVKGSKWKKLGKPHVIENKDGSIRSGAKKLSEFAKRIGADVIIVKSTNRSSVAKFFLGSFAETLLLSSKVPTIVVSPKGKVTLEFNKILFPTDFSASSKRAYTKLLHWAKSLKASVTIYHKIPTQVDPIMVGGIYATGAYITPEEYLVERFTDANSEGNKWIEFAKKRGVKAELEISNSVRSLSEDILQVAKKKKMKMISLVSVATKIETILIGSVARNLVRNASLPILVWPVAAITGANAKKSKSKGKPKLKSTRRIYSV